MLLSSAASSATSSAASPPGTVRFATFNTSLNRPAAGQLVRDLAGGGNAQAQRVAAIIQRVRPDVLLLNEFDYDARSRALRTFRTQYLAVAQPTGGAPIRFRHCFSAAVNTGEPSGMDLDRNGRTGEPGDALGFGAFPGQYGMAVCSRYPLDRARIRTFRRFLWRDMPGNLLPPDWYGEAALARLPLSSKSHWDIPVRVSRQLTIQLLASHPTPPAFEGPEQRNARRNHDEIRLWADYITSGKASYLYDDLGVQGGLRAGPAFVIAGDLNADPGDGASFAGAMAQLLDHSLINSADPPASVGAASVSQRQAGANGAQRGDARHDTADFGDGPGQPGNLRVDYVLPSRDLAICGSGVHWPDGDDTVRLASDHRLVWVDIALAAQCKDSSAPTGQ